MINLLGDVKRALMVLADHTYSEVYADEDAATIELRGRELKNFLHPWLYWRTKPIKAWHWRDDMEIAALVDMKADLQLLVIVDYGGDEVHVYFIDKRKRKGSIGGKKFTCRYKLIEALFSGIRAHFVYDDADGWTSIPNTKFYRSGDLSAA